VSTARVTRVTTATPRGPIREVMPDKRTRTVFRSEFEAGRVRGQGRVRNVSEHGLFVRTRSVPEQGQSVRLCLTLPGGESIEVNGMVWWTTRESGRRDAAPGFGMRIFEENQRFRRLVARLR
jgi:hypothetical protein